jgi:hypothetical protein
MMFWVLIFYIDGSYAGAPATAQFQNKELCLAAHEIMKETWKGEYKGVCVSTAYPDQRQTETGKK